MRPTIGKAFITVARVSQGMEAENPRVVDAQFAKPPRVHLQFEASIGSDMAIQVEGTNPQ